MALIYLASGSGRCGTKSLSAFLDGQRGRSGEVLRAQHETEWQEMAADVLSGRPADVEARLRRFSHQIEVSPVVAMLPYRPLPELPLLGIIRDGRRTVLSGFTTGWYRNPRRAPLHWTGLQPAFGGGRFARCCQFWTWSNQRLRRWGGRLFRLEELAVSQAVRSSLLSCLGLDINPRPFPHLHRAQGTGPAREWRDWPKSWQDAFDLHSGELMDDLYPGWRSAPAGQELK